MAHFCHIIRTESGWKNYGKNLRNVVCTVTKRQSVRRHYSEGCCDNVAWNEIFFTSIFISAKSGLHIFLGITQNPNLNLGKSQAITRNIPKFRLVKTKTSTCPGFCWLFNTSFFVIKLLILLTFSLFIIFCVWEYTHQSFLILKEFSY